MPTAPRENQQGYKQLFAAESTAEKGMHCSGRCTTLFVQDQRFRWENNQREHDAEEAKDGRATVLEHLVKSQLGNGQERKLGYRGKFVCHALRFLGP